MLMRTIPVDNNINRTYFVCVLGIEWEDDKVDVVVFQSEWKRVCVGFSFVHFSTKNPKINQPTRHRNHYKNQFQPFDSRNKCFKPTRRTFVPLFPILQLIHCKEIHSLPNWHFQPIRMQIYYSYLCTLFASKLEKKNREKKTGKKQQTQRENLKKVKYSKWRLAFNKFQHCTVHTYYNWINM